MNTADPLCGASGAHLPGVPHLPGVALGSEVPGQPWARAVPVARVRLTCDWPRVCPARILRGAVVARVDEAVGASVAWHQHGDDGDPAQRPCEVLYRVEPHPEVWLWGPRALAHAAILAQHLHALRLPAGEVVEVRGVEIEAETATVQALGKGWRRYRLVTPYFPTDRAWARRPRTPGPERAAWAGQALRASLSTALGDVGLTPPADLHVHVAAMRDEPVEWERPVRGHVSRVVGFTADFVANVALPDGIGIGKHRVEGFGVLEVRDA